MSLGLLGNLVIGIFKASKDNMNILTIVVTQLARQQPHGGELSNSTARDWLTDWRTVAAAATVRRWADLAYGPGENVGWMERPMTDHAYIVWRITTKFDIIRHHEDRKVLWVVSSIHGWNPSWAQHESLSQGEIKLSYFL